MINFNKKGISYSILLFGVSILIFIAALISGYSSLHEAIDVYAPNSSNDLFKLVSLSDSLSEYHATNSKITFRDNMVDIIPEDELFLINSDSKEDYLFGLERKLSEDYPIKSDGYIEVFMPGNPNVLVSMSDTGLYTNIFSSNYVNYRLSETELSTTGNNKCDIQGDVDFKKYSKCNIVYDKAYEKTGDKEFSLFLTALSYADNECSYDRAYNVLSRLREDKPYYYSENLDGLLDRILNSYEDVKEFQLQEYDKRYLFLYIHHRGGYDIIQNFLKKGFPFQEAISRHCFSFFSNYWDERFENLDENMKLAYNYKQEEYFCRGPKRGLNYPSYVFEVYNNMCDDLGSKITESEVKHEFSPAQVHKVFDVNFEIYRPLIPTFLNMYEDVFDSCLYSDVNISDCFKANLEDEVLLVNEDINQKLSKDGFDVSKSDLLLDNLNDSLEVNLFKDFSKVHAKLERCIKIKNDLNNLSSSLIYDNCNCVTLNDKINLNQGYLNLNQGDFYWNLPISENISNGGFNVDSLSLTYNPDTENYSLEAINSNKDCNFYFNNLDPLYYPIHLSDSNLDLFGTVKLENPVRRTQSYEGLNAHVYQPEKPSEKFFMRWNDVSDELYSLMSYELRIISYDPVNLEISNITTINYHNFQNSFEFEFNYSQAKKYGLSFVNGSSFRISLHAIDWYNHRREIFSEDFQFIDDLPLDFAKIDSGNNLCHGLYKIKSDDQGEINLNWDKSYTLIKESDVDFDIKNYFDDHFNKFLIGYKKNSESDSNSVDITEFNVHLTEDESYTLKNLEEGVNYSIFIQQVDVSNNVIKKICDYSLYE